MVACPFRCQGKVIIPVRTGCSKTRWLPLPRRDCQTQPSHSSLFEYPAPFWFAHHEGGASREPRRFGHVTVHVDIRFEPERV
jgi:hypothetical protein